MDSPHKGQYCGKRFHVMMLPYHKDIFSLPWGHNQWLLLLYHRRTRSPFGEGPSSCVHTSHCLLPYFMIDYTNKILGLGEPLHRHTECTESEDKYLCWTHSIGVYIFVFVWDSFYWFSFQFQWHNILGILVRYHSYILLLINYYSTKYLTTSPLSYFIIPLHLHLV